MEITAELELKLPCISSRQDQPELLHFPRPEPFETEETFLESLHHPDSVLHIFSPVAPNQTDSLANVGFFEVSHGFSLGATFLLAKNTKARLNLTL